RIRHVDRDSETVLTEPPEAEAGREGAVSEEKVKDEADGDQQLKQGPPQKMESLAEGEQENVPGFVERKIDPVQRRSGVGPPHQRSRINQQDGGGKASRPAEPSCRRRRVGGKRVHGRKMRLARSPVKPQREFAALRCVFNRLREAGGRCGETVSLSG